MAAGEVKIDTLTDQEDTLTSAIPLQLYKQAKHVQLQEPAYHKPRDGYGTSFKAYVT